MWQRLKRSALEKKNVDSVQKVANLLNYEDIIATYYWSILVKILRKLYLEFYFVKRGSKSHPRNLNAYDEVNALLNYGYAILESEIRKDINTVG